MSIHTKLISSSLKTFCLLLLAFCTFSCIPLQIAPNIEGAKIYKGKKFKRQLPKQCVYVFEDPKDANEFYTYINAKYDIDYDIGGANVPISIDNKKYYLTFYEVERNTKTVNLVPIVADAAMDSKGIDPVFENHYTSRSGSWYIALTVTDETFQDNLKESDPAYKNIMKHLDNLRNEYLTTANYMEIYLKR
ncbi:hypothetical protein Aeqsu_1363 [Aequorivita sublithincola DSM 14238]|uniref:Lipoprotein n=1 Tax=Aequorivita sublithincola (strain DSM 14238 / LMG 21431 / ACAM 643 / 9-3) TaxID=746697 RepID=I3YV38_AEQSU|nr:hypothetical protein [Aequorivita sublithincola]AFL80856.1 hypothetical protein Aeqsu_1363 [Aequorivita sublithincola DSM 14238]